jgi:hypothetical protein
MADEIERIPLLIGHNAKVDAANAPHGADADQCVHVICTPPHARSRRASYFLRKMLKGASSQAESRVSPLDRRSEVYRHSAAEAKAKAGETAGRPPRQNILTIPNTMTFTRLLMVGACVHMICKCMAYWACLIAAP